MRIINIQILYKMLALYEVTVKGAFHVKYTLRTHCRNEIPPKWVFMTSYITWGKEENCLLVWTEQTRLHLSLNLLLEFHWYEFAIQAFQIDQNWLFTKWLPESGINTPSWNEIMQVFVSLVHGTGCSGHRSLCDWKLGLRSNQ